MFEVHYHNELGAEVSCLKNRKRAIDTRHLKMRLRQ
jgi:hypothetical protein